MASGNYFRFVILLCMFLFLFGEVKGYQNVINNVNDPFRHIQVLDTKGKYVLEWQVDVEEKKITFNVTVETRGYVGFGLAKKGLMDKADIVIGGVYSNGKPYFSDRHGKGHEVPVVDASQDYTLLDARESNSHTFLSFSRSFETCDTTNDVAITDDEVLAVIWAYGEKDDELEYHHQNKGEYYVYLLDPDLTPPEIREQRYRNVTIQSEIDLEDGDWKVWRIPITYDIKPQDTTYICTFHKAPQSPRKQHIVGIRPILNELERKHIHHFIIHACYAPQGVDPSQIFERYLGHPGEECYILPAPTTIPTHYCLDFKHEWAVGGESLFLPEHVGLPFTETYNEYYMLQVHYDNPNLLPNLRMQFSIEVYYTPKLREHDGGVVAVGLRPEGPTIVVPPFETNHIIYGHCAGQCTQKMLPPTGVNVFATRLHTHLTGTGARFMYINGKQEGRISIDDNYNFNYQAYRILRNEVRITPGDLMYSRCFFTTTNRNHTTVGGYATRDEMCHGWYWYYPLSRDQHSLCVSGMRSDVYRDFLQIQNVTWSNEVRENIVTSPPQNAGLKVSEALSRQNWNIDRRIQLQTHHRFLPQISQCASVGPDSPLVRAIDAALLAAQGGTPPSPAPSPALADHHYLLSSHKIAGQQQPRSQSQTLPQIPLRPISTLRRQSFYRKDVGRIESNRPRVRTFTDLDKEIAFPGNEFVYLWPEGLVSYKRPSTCPATS